MKQFCTALLLLLSFYSSPAQGIITSQRCFGGSKSDNVSKVLPNADGSYVIFGYTSSTDGDVTGLHGTQNSDLWLAKVDSNNTIEWNKCLGGTGQEEPHDIIALREGGYLVLGISNLANGDVTQNYGSYDAWVVKLDNSGNIRWQKSFGGGSSDDVFHSAMQNKAGNYILSGHTASTDNGIIGNHGSADAWVMELDTFGNKIWQYCYGGPGYDQLFRGAAEDAEGNYYFSGIADSGISGNHGSSDLWVIKTDATGHLLKQKCFGGTSGDYAFCLQLLSNGTIAIAGGTASSDGDVTQSIGDADGWVIAIDTGLNLLWQTSVGSGGSEQLNSVTEMNGRIAVVGTTDSNDGNVGLFNHGGYYDIYAATLNLSGTLLKQICYGGTGSDEGNRAAITTTGELYICGRTDSNNGNVSGNHGSKDGWVAKTTLPDWVTGIIEPMPALNSLSVYPNPTTGSFQVQFVSNEKYAATMQLINLLGETVSTKQIDVQQGSNTFFSTTSTLPKGMYVLQIANATGKDAVHKIIVE